MTEYIEGTIYLHPSYIIPIDPKEALLHIKESRKPSINKIIEAMEYPNFYSEIKNLKLPD